MQPVLKIINIESYIQSKYPKIFKIDYPRVFGVILNESGFNFKLEWQSELIIPEIKNLTENIFSVGIDLNFGIIDSEMGSIILNLKLNYFFYEFISYNGIGLIITELEIIKISLCSYKILDTIDLPDFFTSINLKNDMAEILCSNNFSFLVNI